MEEWKHAIEETKTSRERILASLEHQQLDRVPRDLGGTTATGINIITYRNFVDYLGL
jgi:uroporphyrinogen decarboxylase